MFTVPVPCFTTVCHYNSQEHIIVIEDAEENYLRVISIGNASKRRILCVRENPVIVPNTGPSLPYWGLGQGHSSREILHCFEEMG